MSFATPAQRPVEASNPPATRPPAEMADGKTISMFRPARPLRQVMPDLNIFGGRAVYRPTRVEVRVTIDTNGRVRDAQIIAGDSKVKAALAGVALIAARQWLFEPASLRGKPIQSEHSIVFAFEPPKQ
jgi:TonB family protein